MAVTRKNKNTILHKFCKCIKSVQKKPGNESSAIAICVSSVLQQKRKRTLHSFRCTGKQPYIRTQVMK
jgi:hypothetical protein